MAGGRFYGFWERKRNGPQIPCKQPAFSGCNRGNAGTLLTLNFLYSTRIFLSDAPLAQLDRALDFGSNQLETIDSNRPPKIPPDSS